MNPAFHSIGILALGYTQDVASDQENHKEDSQTVEVNNELTDYVSLHPGTLVRLTSSLTSGYANIFCSPKTWTGPGAAVTASARGPTAVSSSLCTLRYWQLRALTFLGGISNDLCPRSSNRDIHEALEREVADRTCAKPFRPKEALQKDSFWRKKQIC